SPALDRSHPDVAVTMWLSSSSEEAPWAGNPLSPPPARIPLPGMARCHPGGEACELAPVRHFPGLGISAEPPCPNLPEQRAKPGSLCSPSTPLPLTHGPGGWSLQWKGTSRQGQLYTVPLVVSGSSEREIPSHPGN
ncbi:hypothetical protein E2I00_014297, partial [Balaenoptera physalus]